MSESARDPDDIHGDAVVFALEIKVRRNGAMSVAGGIQNEQYALAVLDAARQSIKSHNARGKIEGTGLIVPSSDTPWSKFIQ
jgi:hypothetical protein